MGNLRQPGLGRALGTHVACIGPGKRMVPCVPTGAVQEPSEGVFLCDPVVGFLLPTASFALLPPSC